MESNSISLKTRFIPSFELEHSTGKMSLSDVFCHRTGSYLNEFYLYAAYFNRIPNFISEKGIDCKKANKWFTETFEREIKDCYYSKRYFENSKEAELDDVFYFLYDDLIVNFDTNWSFARFLFKKTPVAKVEEIALKIKKFRNTKSKPEISLLINAPGGIETKSLQITKPKLNIQNNYNNDFKEIHQTILKRLSKKNDKGLILLHGKPGTGKTSYIRYLICSVKKNVIFLPPNMAGAITNPNLISILIGNPNSIFVIEDAENIVVDRERDGNSPVSALLNISDGLLSDCLKGISKNCLFFE